MGFDPLESTTTKARPMKWPRVKVSVRRLMGLVAIVALCFGIADEVRARKKAARYRLVAEKCAQMASNCREIAEWDAATKTRMDQEEFPGPHNYDPDWNRKMVLYYAELERILRQASLNPRRPLPPLPPAPG